MWPLIHSVPLYISLHIHIYEKGNLGQLKICKPKHPLLEKYYRRAFDTTFARAIYGNGNPIKQTKPPVSEKSKTPDQTICSPFLQQVALLLYYPSIQILSSCIPHYSCIPHCIGGIDCLRHLFAFDLLLRKRL